MCATKTIQPNQQTSVNLLGVNCKLSKLRGANKFGFTRATKRTLQASNSLVLLQRFVARRHDNIKQSAVPRTTIFPPFLFVGVCGRGDPEIFGMYRWQKRQKGPLSNFRIRDTPATWETRDLVTGMEERRWEFVFGSREKIFQFQEELLNGDINQKPNKLRYSK